MTDLNKHQGESRPRQPKEQQKWFLTECEDGGLERKTYVAQIRTRELFICETTDRHLAQRFKRLVDLHNASLGDEAATGELRPTCDFCGGEHVEAHCPEAAVWGRPEIR